MSFLKRPQSLHFSQSEVQNLDFLTKYRTQLEIEKEKKCGIEKQSVILKPFSSSMLTLNNFKVKNSRKNQFPNSKKSKIFLNPIGESPIFGQPAKKRRSIAVIGKFLKKSLGRVTVKSPKTKKVSKIRNSKMQNQILKRKCSIASMEFWEEDYETIKRKSSIINHIH